MNFEEFLKEKKGFGSDGYYFCQDSKGTEIEIKALGEWAITNLKEIEKFTQNSCSEILLAEKIDNEFSRKFFETDF